jgi:hypothetical protein
VEHWAGGWVGTDPTNRIWADDRHVIVARGRDYSDVPPLKGLYYGAPLQHARGDGRRDAARLGMPCCALPPGALACADRPAVAHIDLEGEAVMKKILIAVAAAAGSVLAILKLRSNKSEQKLWAEATDSVPPSPTPPSEG